MRASAVLAGILLLVVGGCANKANHAPPSPPDKKLLAGKWKNASEGQFLAGYEFADDGTVKASYREMKSPVTGRYTWAGERSLELEFAPAEDVRAAYRKAAEAYKQDVKDRIKAGKLPDRAGPSILGGVRDELPAKQTYRVGLSASPPLLMLSTEDGTSLTLEKAE